MTFDTLVKNKSGRKFVFIPSLHWLYSCYRDFWAIVREFGEKQKKQLLQFSTGSDRIPLGGLAKLKFIIVKNGPDSDRFYRHLCIHVYIYHHQPMLPVLTCIHNVMLNTCYIIIILYTIIYIIYMYYTVKNSIIFTRNMQLTL